MDDKLITIGKIAGTHGLKGDVKIMLDDVDPKLLSPEMELEVIEGHRQLLKIQSFSASHRPIAHFYGIDSIEMAQAIVGKRLALKRSHFPKLHESEFYICDLINLECRDEKNEVIGIVKNYYLSKVQTILTIKTKNNEEFDIPYVRDFILEINIPAFIKIKVPDYI
jgi:16S rRNA processing protein RimM